LIGENQYIFFNWRLTLSVLYYLELQMAGIILLTAMVAGGISLWLKRRKAQNELERNQNDLSDNF
jgi:hypothetical protein